MKQFRRHQHAGRNISTLMLIVIIAVVLMSAGAGLWILNIEGVVTGPWSTISPIVFTLLGCLYGLLQWHAQLLENKPVDPTHTDPPNIPQFLSRIETDESIEKLLQELSLLSVKKRVLILFIE